MDVSRQLLWHAVSSTTLLLLPQILHNLDRACETFAFGSGGEAGGSQGQLMLGFVRYGCLHGWAACCLCAARARPPLS